VSGAGTLAVNNPGGSIRVGSIGGYSGALLDASGLSTMNVNLGNNGILYIGNDTTFQSSNAGQNCTFKLAQASTITAGTLSMSGHDLTFGGTVVNALQLGGGANALNISSIYLGANEPVLTGNNSRATTAVLQFAGSTGSVTVRDASGAGRAELEVGIVNHNFSNIVATADFSGHSADLSLGTLGIGNYNAINPNGTYFANGAMTFNSGILDVTTVNMGSSANASGLGSGTLNIGGGTTTIGSGGLVIANSGAGTVNLTGGLVTLGADIIQNSGAGSLTLNGATLDLASHNIGGATTPITTLNFYSGTLKNVTQINNGAGLTKDSTGTLTLDGAIGYTGYTVINAGALVLGNGVNLNDPSGVAVVGGTLANTGTNSIAGPVSGGYSTANTIAPGGIGQIGALNLQSTLGLTGSSALHFDVYGSNNDALNIAGVLTVFGQPKIQIATSGTLSGDYQLASFAASPGLNNGSFAPLPTVPGYVWWVNQTGINLRMASEFGSSYWTGAAEDGNWTSGNWSGLIPMAPGNIATFDTHASGGAIAVDTVPTISGLVFNNAAQSYTIGGNAGNPLTLVGSNAGAPATIAVNAGSHTVAAPLLLQSNLIVTPGAGTMLNISGNIGELDGSHSLRMNGVGTLLLSGSNNYTGGTTVNSGLLQLGSSNAISGGALQVNGGRLDIGSYDATATAVTLTGGTISSAGATLTGTSFNVQSGVVSAILGGASAGLTKTTSGTVVLASVNAYGGLTDVQAGTLKLGADQAIPVDLQISGGTLDLNGYSTTAGTVTVLGGAITGSGSSSLSGLAYNVQSGSIGANLGDLGNSTLTKTSAGTLVLSGSNDYQGGTIVTGGTLIVQNVNAIADGTSLTVGNPAAFAPAPVVPSQAVSAAQSIAPVPEPGTLTLLAAVSAFAGWSLWRKRVALGA
jgi:autotransporter-associated beta strand protein